MLFRLNMLLLGLSVWKYNQVKKCSNEMSWMFHGFF